MDSDQTEKTSKPDKQTVESSCEKTITPSKGLLFERKQAAVPIEVFKCYNYKTVCFEAIYSSSGHLATVDFAT